MFILVCSFAYRQTTINDLFPFAVEPNLEKDKKSQKLGELLLLLLRSIVELLSHLLQNDYFFFVHEFHNKNIIILPSTTCSVQNKCLKLNNTRKTNVNVTKARDNEEENLNNAKKNQFLVASSTSWFLHYNQRKKKKARNMYVSSNCSSTK